MRVRRNSAAGFTLVELVIVVAIVGILAAAVLPLAHWSVKREREYELQESLRIIRNAIDRYHDLAAAGAIEVPPGGTGYPPNLDVLVEGVELVGEIPAPVPGVSDEYAATGFGLVGGYTGARQGQQAAGDIGMTQGEDTGRRGGGAGNLSLQGGGTSPMQQMRNQMGQRGTAGLDTSGLGNQGGARPQGFGFGGRPAGGLAADRGRAGAPGASAADVQKIVFLRRLPVDPMTGEADWGLRCYGDGIDDRSWCGRNVFDVYSRARGQAMDGRPYREW